MINARSDAFFKEGNLNEAIRRGRVLGQGPRLSPGGLRKQDLAELGVARVSIGPQLFLAAIAVMKTAAGRVCVGLSSLPFNF